MMNEPISSIMTTEVITVSPLDTLNAVKKVLFEKRIHHIPVVDDDKLVGIITSYDLMDYNVKFEQYEDILVEDLMTKKVITLGPKEKIGAAAQVFLRHLFHGMPIVNEAGELAGIVTTHDILRYNFDKAYPNDPLEQAYRGKK